MLSSLDRPVWYDEVFTLDATRGPRSESLDVWRGDVHPPLYYLIVSLFRSLASADYAILLGRLVNLLFLAVAAVAVIMVDQRLGRRCSVILVGLLLANSSVAYFSVELRSYFGMMALSLLMTVALTFGRGRVDFVIGLVSSVALSQLHFFGTAMALATIGWHFLVASKEGRRCHAFAFATCGIAMVIGFALWVMMSLPRMQYIAENGFWITRVELAAITFASSLAMVASLGALLGLISLAARGQVVSREVGSLALPALTVLVVTHLLSIYQPIITPRNLLVLLPSLALIGMWGLQAVNPRVIVDAVLVGFIALQLPFLHLQFQPRENAEAIAELALNEDCSGKPMAAPKVDHHHWERLAAVFERPTRPTLEPSELIDALRAEPMLMGQCKMLAADHNLSGWIYSYVTDLERAGVPVSLEYVLSPRANRVHGLTIVLTPGIEAFGL
ncbi:MAG: hypothetical protein AAFQ79_12420 [Pseudomonadota bacterium]